MASPSSSKHRDEKKDQGEGKKQAPEIGRARVNEHPDKGFRPLAS